MSDEIRTGYDMWQDHKNHYGIITARIMCIRYLDLQSRSKDPAEHEFCRELREAMAMEKNLRNAPLYLFSIQTARERGEERLFDDSDYTNLLCAGVIDDAINACEYQDGSYKMKPAVKALIEHYGSERLSYVLATEVWRNKNSFSTENREWAQGFTLESGFAYGSIRSHPRAVNVLIDCFREEIERIQGKEEKSSVIKAIRESKDTPKSPKKQKSKNGAEL